MTTLLLISFLIESSILRLNARSSCLSDPKSMEYDEIKRIIWKQEQQVAQNLCPRRK